VDCIILSGGPRSSALHRLDLSLLVLLGHAMSTFRFTSAWMPLLAIAWLFADSTAVDAQMFGARTVGRTLSRQASPGSSEGTGTVRNQRFVRGNRSAANFVGSDRSEAGSFVGTQQAGLGAAIRSAASGIQAAADEANQVNRPVPRPGKGDMYPPRLAVGFDYEPASGQELANRITAQVQKQGLPIEVWVEGRTAILRGAVASEEEQALARHLVEFEPGISAVRSELTVGPPSAATPLPLPVPTSPSPPRP